LCGFATNDDRADTLSSAIPFSKFMDPPMAGSREHVKNCMGETAKTFHGCFIVFLLAFCFECSTVEIKTVLFQLYFSYAGTVSEKSTVSD